MRMLLGFGKFLKVIFYLAFFFSALAQDEIGQDTKSLERAEAKAIAKWGFPERGKELFGSLWDGGNLVKEVMRLENPLLEKYLPNHQVYRIRVYNPGSAIAGRSFHPHALILQDKKVWYLDSKEETMKFISGLELTVEDETEALEMISLFALLRDFSQVTEKPAEGYNLYQSAPDEWLTSVAENDNGWTIHCALMVDPAIKLCVRWRFKVQQDGKIEIEGTQNLFGSGYE